MQIVEGFVRPKHVAERLGISKPKVYQMIDKGIFDSRRIDGCVVVLESSLNRYIKELLERRND